MKNWNIVIDITRYDDGFSLEAKLPGDTIKRHKVTKEEFMKMLTNGVSAKIDELEAEFNSE